MKKLLVALISLVFFNEAMATDISKTYFDRALGCFQWEEILDTIPLERFTKEEIFQFQGAHERQRLLLLQASTRLQNAIESSNYYRIALICATAENATRGFSKQCFGDLGQELISLDFVSQCLNYRLDELENLPFAVNTKL